MDPSQQNTNQPGYTSTPQQPAAAVPQYPQPMVAPQQPQQPQQFQQYAQPMPQQPQAVGPMGPINPILNDWGKLFASAYALSSGVVFVTSIGILFAPIAHRVFHKFNLEEGADSL